MSRVQSLQKLCLKAVGRQLKHFCNLQLHPTVAQALSGPEKQLIYAYDLSRLDAFDAQAFLQVIDRWCAKMERNWRRRRGHLAPKRVDRAMKHYLRYVLLPLAGSQPDDQLLDLAITLDLAAAPKLELRTSTASVKPRKKWVSAVIENANDVDEDEPLEFTPQDEIVCYRLPVASVGCGIIAGMLQHSSSMVKLRLNNCHITDAGAILLASGIRITTTLELVDVSNEESAYSEEPMSNEIGDNGVQAIALALEQNQSVKELDLSGNPVGFSGTIALTSMLRKNRILERLYLDRTRVKHCAEPLIDLFQASKSLNRLSMQWCSLRPGVGTRLAAVQAAKTTL